MIHWTDLLLGGSLGVVLGLGFAWLWHRGRVADVRTRSTVLEDAIRRLQNENEQLRNELKETHSRREEATQRVVALTEQVNAREQQLAEQRKILDDAQAKLKDVFRAVGAEALAANSKQFLELAKKTLESQVIQAKGDAEKKQQAIDHLVKPIKDLLEKQNTAVGNLEKKREVAYGRLEEQIKAIAASHDKLSTETGRLVTALRRPEQRGRWGEMQLRNAVEMAGMTEHCDFEEQVQTEDRSTRDRPDMTVHLPGGGLIIVDAKVALDAYLDALEPDADRDARLNDHANQVERHYKGLANKRYWEQFERTPKLVVMFLPLESALVAALEKKPELHADAMRNHVLIATPTLLVALLRAVAFGWQQEALAENAREISKVGKELHDRIARFVGHFDKIGTNLHRSTKAYNDAVGSLERMVLPGARRLKELQVTTNPDVESPPRLDTEVRDFVTADIEPPTDTNNAGP